MCTDITKGRKLACKDQRAGIKQVDFAVYINNLDFEIAAQEATVIPGAIEDVFRYELKGAGNVFTEEGTTDMDKRTHEVKQTLALLLQKMSKESEVELKALTSGRVIAFVYDYNGNVKVVGIDSGMELASRKSGTDISGYTVNLEAVDKDFAPFLSASAKTALEALISSSNVTP